MEKPIDYVKERNKVLKASIIGACILIAIIGFAIFSFETEIKKITCTVVTHDAVGDRAGNIEYYTLCECEDNTVRRLRGSDYYVLEKGSSFYYKYEELNLSEDFKQIFK